MANILQRFIKILYRSKSVTSFYGKSNTKARNTKMDDVALTSGV